MIKVRNLHKAFKHLQVLNGISLDVPAGQVVAIIGPSCSGKSTFLRSLNLLEVPTQGEIYIDDECITESKFPIEKVRQKTGMVFQHFHLFPHMTVLENLTYAPVKIKKLSKTVAKNQAVKLLKQVGLTDKANVYPGKLSGGQKQRAAIARALAIEPEILLFDEPTSSLDPEMVKEVLEVIKTLVQTGITMILVTHEMGFAREVADRILFMDHGQIIYDAPPQEFFTKPQSKRAQQFLAKVLP